MAIHRHTEKKQYIMAVVMALVLVVAYIMALVVVVVMALCTPYIGRSADVDR